MGMGNDMLLVIFSLSRLVLLEAFFVMFVGMVLSPGDNEMIRVGWLAVGNSIAILLEIFYSKCKYIIVFPRRDQHLFWKNLYIYIWVGIGFNLFNNWIYKCEMVNTYILNQQNSSQINSEFTWMGSMFFACMIGIAGPILEELYFRGILHGILKWRYGSMVTSMIIAAIWALHHSEWFMYLYVFPMGVFISLLYFKRQNILIPITIHVSNNLFSLLRTVIWDDGIFPHMVKIGTVMLMLGTIVIYWQILGDERKDSEDGKVF